MSLKVLIDWDNLADPHARKGLIWIAERILGIATATGILVPRDVHFRLYGGWFDESRLSRRGQILSAEAQRDFPRRISLNANAPPSTATLEMAYSLASLPSHVLLKTYRVRGEAPKNLQFSSWPPVGCASRSNCGLRGISALLQSGACHTNRCGVTVEASLSRPEQKLVDTMLVADLIQYSLIEKQGDLVVVSSDDDVIPGVISSIQGGARILQVHTRAGRVTDVRYTTPLGKQFLQAALS